MARQTRQERRERREAQGATEHQRADARPLPRPVAAPAAEGAGRPSEGPAPVRFVRESWGELKKVEWPGQQQLIQGTVVVLIACLVVGAYLYLNDKVWQYVVHHLLLK